MSNFQDYWDSIKKNRETPVPQQLVPGVSNGPEFSMNPMDTVQNIQQAGGYALTKTLSGLSAVSQGVFGFFRALEDDKSMYEDFWKVDDKGRVRFHNNFGALFSNAALQGRN